MPCPNFVKPADANNTANNWTMPLSVPSQSHWLYINAGNVSKVWVKSGNCNYTGVSANSLGDQINLTIENHLYRVYVLDVNVTDGMQGVVIGLVGVNKTIIEPLRTDNDAAMWLLMSLNISGQIYQVLLANDTTIDYPMCSAWNQQECAKKAWFDTDGNFNDAVNATIGQNLNIISDFYLTRVGPGGWEGVSVANFSQIQGLGLAHYPGIDAKVKDGTTSWFGVLDESTLNIDLNKDGGKNMTFYMFNYDQNENGQQVLTQNIIDDDLNMTEEFWSDQTDPQNPQYKDFYGNETGIKEYGRNLPRGAETGSAAFGESQGNWEQSPEWDIANYNGSAMILRKWRWQFQTDENMKIILKVYDFSQTPITGANVSVEKLIRFGQGAISYNGSLYSNATQTDSSGWAVLTLTNSSWTQGQYMVQVRIQNGANIERSNKWFQVGQGGP
jgi:hypothetical protein